MKEIVKDKIYIKNYTDKVLDGKYSHFITVSMGPREIMEKFLNSLLKYYNE